MVLNSVGKQVRFWVTLSLVFTLIFAILAQPVANAAEVDSKEEVEKLALAIYESSTYQEDTKSFDFNKEKAISLGLDKQVASQIEVYYENLSTEEAEDLAKLQKDDEVSVMVAPILVWAAGVLAAAGLSWLAEKLLDYGAKKFCDAYGNYNSVTKTVCNVIAP